MVLFKNFLIFILILTSTLITIKVRTVIVTVICLYRVKSFLIQKYITFGTKITDETKVNGIKVSRRRKPISRVKYEKQTKKKKINILH